jgi:hypothetical protein
MKRRRIIAMFGAGTVGGSTVFSTGAFTSASATRGVSISVAADADAFLRLAPCKGSENGDYVTDTSAGTMSLDLSPSNPNLLGDGVNVDATTTFDDVFEICNQGTQPVGVWIEVDPVQNGNGNDAVAFYRNGDRSTSVVGPGNPTCLDVGDCVCVGFVTRTDGIGPGDDLLQSLPDADGREMVIHADANVGCATTPGGGLTTVPGPSSGLVSYWPLDSVGDGVAEDVVGGNDGAHSGVSPATGQVGGAGSFDGIDDYVNVPDDPTLDITDALTLAAWIKPPSGQDDYARIVSREQSGAGNRQYNLGLDANAQDPRVVVDTVDSDGIAVSGTLPADLVTDDQWHHVVMTFNRTSAIRLYLDGSEVDSQAVSSSLVSRASTVKFGAPAHLPGKDWFAGRIDDVRIYDRALSASELMQLYDTTK